MALSAVTRFTQLLEEGCISSSAVQKINRSLIERTSEELCEYIGRLGPDLDELSNFLNAVQYLVKHNSGSCCHLQDVGILTLMSAVLQKTLARLSRDGPSDNLQIIIEQETDTVNVLAESDASAKSEVFLALCPHLLDFLLHGMLCFQTKMEVLKATNMLLEQCRTSYKERFLQDDHVRKKITDFVNLIKSIGDYEFQVCQIECLMRLFPRKSRHVYAADVFTDKQMLTEFLSIRDQEFEVDCRSFLNEVNGRTENPSKGVFSIPCVTSFVGRKQLLKPSDEGYEEFWVDFNTGSYRLTLFCEQDSLLSQCTPTEDSEWETVAVYKVDILKYECNMSEDICVLKIWLKSPVCHLYPSQHQDVIDNTITVHFLSNYEEHVLSAVDLIFDFSEKRHKVSTVEKPLHINMSKVQEEDSQSSMCPPTFTRPDSICGSQDSRRRKVSVPSVPMKNPAFIPSSSPAKPVSAQQTKPPEKRAADNKPTVPTTPKSNKSKTQQKVKTPVVTVTVPDKAEKKRKKREKQETMKEVKEKIKEPIIDNNEEDLVIPESQPADSQPEFRMTRNSTRTRSQCVSDDRQNLEDQRNQRTSSSQESGKANKNVDKKPADAKKNDAEKDPIQNNRKKQREVTERQTDAVRKEKDVDEDDKEEQIPYSQSDRFDSIPDSLEAKEHASSEDDNISREVLSSSTELANDIQVIDETTVHQSNSNTVVHKTGGRGGRGRVKSNHKHTEQTVVTRTEDKKKSFTDVDKSLKELCDLDDQDHVSENSKKETDKIAENIIPDKDADKTEQGNEINVDARYQQRFCKIDEELVGLENIGSDSVKLSRDQKKHKSRNKKDGKGAKTSRSNKNKEEKSDVSLQENRREMRKWNVKENKVNYIDDTDSDKENRIPTTDTSSESEKSGQCEKGFTAENDKTGSKEKILSDKVKKKLNGRGTAERKVLSEIELDEVDHMTDTHMENSRSSSNDKAKLPSHAEAPGAIHINVNSDDDSNGSFDDMSTLGQKSIHGEMKTSRTAVVKNKKEEAAFDKNVSASSRKPRETVSNAAACRAIKEFEFEDDLQIKNSPHDVSAENKKYKGNIFKNKGETSVCTNTSLLGRVERMKCNKKDMNVSKTISQKQNRSMVFEWSYSRSQSKVSKKGLKSHDTIIKKESDFEDPYDFASQEYADSSIQKIKQEICNQPKKKQASKKQKCDAVSKKAITDKRHKDSEKQKKNKVDRSNNSSTLSRYDISMWDLSEDDNKDKPKTTICQDKKTKKWFRKHKSEENVDAQDDSGYGQADDTNTSREVSSSSPAVSDTGDDVAQENNCFSNILKDIALQRNKESKSEPRERKMKKGHSEAGTKVSNHHMLAVDQTPICIPSVSSTPRVISSRKKMYSPLDISVIKTPESCERVKLDISDEPFNPENTTYRKKHSRQQKKVVKYQELSDSDVEEISDNTSTMSPQTISLLDTSCDVTKSEKSWIMEKKKGVRKKTPKVYNIKKDIRGRVEYPHTDNIPVDTGSSDESLIMEVESFPKLDFSTHIDTPVMRDAGRMSTKADIDSDVMILTPYTPLKGVVSRREEEDIEVFQTQENLTVSLNVSCEDGDDIRSASLSGLYRKYLQDENESFKEDSPVKKRPLHHSLKNLLGDSGFVSGPSSEVRPTMSHLKRKYADIQLPECEESEEEEEKEEPSEMEQSILMPKKLFKLDPASYLSKGSSPVGTSVVSDLTDLDLYNPAAESNMGPFLTTFGSAVQKHVKERQHKIQQCFKQTHKGAMKHFNDTWIEQQQIQSNLTDDYHMKMTTELMAMEKDIARLKDAELQTEEMYKSQLDLLRSNHKSQKTRLANMASIQNRHREKTTKMKDYNRKIQKGVHEKLRAEMTNLQKTLIQDAQKDEYMNIKKRLQKMF